MATMPLKQVDRVEILTMLKELNPALIVPATCTGWKATHMIARELPEAFVPNSVGTRFML